ncbi:hypothetical protein C6B37_01780, partial [Candidatus Phytoplasma phoenicium]
LFFILFIFILILNYFKPQNNVQDCRPTYDKVKKWFEEHQTEAKQEEYFKQNTENKINIVFWHNLYPEEEEALKGIIEKFEKQYPRIKVIATHKGNWFQIIRSVANALPVNKQPHLVVSYPDYIEFYSKSHKVVPLNEFFIEKDEVFKKEKDQIFTYFLPPDGTEKNYLPFLKTTEVIFYNKDLLKKIYSEELRDLIGKDGSITKEIITWEDLKRICKTLKKFNQKDDFIPIIVESENNLINYNYRYKYLNEHGKEFPTTKEEAQELLQKHEPLSETIKYFKNFYDEKFLTTPILNKENKDVKDLFAKQKSCIFISSTRRTNNFFNLEFELGLHQSPIFDVEVKDEFKDEFKGFNLVQGSNINLFYSPIEDEMIASWMFLKHLITKDTYKKLFDEKSGLCIVRKDLKTLLKEQQKQQKNKPSQKENKGKEFVKFKFLEFALEQKAFFTTPVFEDVCILRDLFRDLFIKILTLEVKREELNEQIDYLFQETYKRFATI